MKINHSSLFIAFIIFLSSCASVKKFNEEINIPKSPEKLKADVDYTYNKLKHLHPNLYWYISKEALDYKFDSLKSSINAPMTSNEFFFKLSPLIASVRQGHTRIYPVSKKLTKKEIKALSKKGGSQLSKFEYEIFDNKLYIVKNNSKDSTIKIGSEVISVNNIKPNELISKYKGTFTSDGFNETFFNKAYSRLFPNYFYVETGQLDSITLKLNYKDSLSTVLLNYNKKRIAETDSTKATKHIVPKTTSKKDLKKEAKKRRIQGYNAQTKKYGKDLKFMETDSSIAVMDINDFTLGNFRKFYQSSFKQLKERNTKALVIDLRNNTGGRLLDICNLYSYLTDTTFYFIDRIEITSRTSYIFGDISSNTPVVFKVLGYTIGLPFMLGMEARVSKNEGKFYFHPSESRHKHPKQNNFKGKVYVLINGGSFSASSIISSDLKGSKRAFFVGEETGGAYNGCVAGRMPSFILPNSKLRIQIGLGTVRPHYKTSIEGRGIFPDKEILPTIEDRIKGNDPELNWVIEDIEGKHNRINSSDQK